MIRERETPKVIFFFQAEDGIRDGHVTGVQTCAFRSTAYLLQTGQGVLQAVFSTSFLVEPVDKITTCMLAFAIVQGLSRRFVARFPRPENVEAEGGASQTQLYIAVGVVVLLVLFAAFVLRNVLGG